MADPLTIAAGTVSIVQRAVSLAASVREQTVSARSASPRLETLNFEISIYSKILEEVSQIALSGTSQLPESATLTLQLCNLHLSAVAAKLDHAVKAAKVSKILKQDDLATSLKDYRRSVKMLRAIVMDVMTQELLQKNSEKPWQREGFSSMNGLIQIQNHFDISEPTEEIERRITLFTGQLQTMLMQNREINGKFQIMNTFTDRGAHREDLSEDALLQLRKAAGAIAQTGTDAAGSNPFDFAARVLGLPEHNNAPIMICATFDTGSAENLISSSVIDRAGLLDRVDSPPLTSIRGADGNFLEPTGSISITWSRNSKQSWETDFLIVDKAPFDMVLGRRFIVAEGVFVFSDPVLVADYSRLSALSKDELLQMEQNARLKDPQNHGLSMRREAMDKAARERRRAEKAASRMSLATTPGSGTPAYQETPSMRSSVPPTNGSSTPAYRQTTSSQSDAASRVRSVDDAQPPEELFEAPQPGSI